MAVVHKQAFGNVLHLEVDANPDGSISAPKTSTAHDSTNGKFYVNTDGATTWRKAVLVEDGAAVNSRFVDWDVDIVGATPAQVAVGDMLAFELPNNQTRAVISNFEVANDVDLTVNPTLNVQFVVSDEGTGAGDVRFEMDVRYIDVGEQADKTIDETLTVDKTVVNTEDQLQEVSFTFNASLIANGDRVSLRLKRLGGDANDTFDGDIAILETSNGKVAV